MLSPNLLHATQRDFYFELPCSSAVLIFIRTFSYPAVKRGNFSYKKKRWKTPSPFGLQRFPYPASAIGIRSFFM